MNSIYSSIVIFFNKNSKIDLQKTAELIEENKKNNIRNYFIEKYYYDEFDFSNINQTNYYNEIFNLLPQGSKIIMDLSSELYFNAEKVIKKLDQYNNDIFYSFNINLKILEDYKDGQDYLFKLFNYRDRELYLEMTPQALEQKEVLNIITENDIKGIIFDTNYDPDLDIEYLEQFKNKNLDIIYKADDLYLTALRNNNSIISSYAVILTEEFNNIWHSFQEGNIEQAIYCQEKLNISLNSLQNINIFKAIKFYCSYKKESEKNKKVWKNIKLSCEEKNNLEKIFS